MHTLILRFGTDDERLYDEGNTQRRDNNELIQFIYRDVWHDSLFSYNFCLFSERRYRIGRFDSFTISKQVGNRGS